MSDHGWVIRAWIGEREITKHTSDSAEAKRIAKRLKDAAATLGLLDIFRCEVSVSEY